MTYKGLLIASHRKQRTRKGWQKGYNLAQPKTGPRSTSTFEKPDLEAQLSDAEFETCRANPKTKHCRLAHTGVGFFLFENPSFLESSKFYPEKIISLHVQTIGQPTRDMRALYALTAISL